MSSTALYNTKTLCKEEFRPLEPGHARIYSCGPTVYSPQHIGNLRPYLFADLLRRSLGLDGLRVMHVINVTDVGHLTDDADAGEDKMEKAASETGRRAEDIAREYTEQWLSDRRRVNVDDPDVLCRATDHIEDQIAMVEKLEAKGFTYAIADGIYFDTSKFPRYAEFARLDLEMQRGGERIGEVAGKRHAADFALWKFAAEGVKRQQEWDSPWGRGFPGWHIECSAMSVRYLGERFDIHTGGVEHVRVHHTNEIAQTECALDVHPWVSVWMHEDWIVFDGEKMSKSLGNIYVLQDI
ncbi:MAG: cysteine--tRNA ligase, partial [Myxococcota bacterium]